MDAITYLVACALIGPDERWLTENTAVRQVAGDAQGRLYRVVGPLADNAC